MKLLLSSANNRILHIIEIIGSQFSLKAEFFKNVTTGPLIFINSFRTQHWQSHFQKSQMTSCCNRTFAWQITANAMKMLIQMLICCLFNQYSF